MSQRHDQVKLGLNTKGIKVVTFVNNKFALVVMKLISCSDHENGARSCERRF